ncbi:MAG: exopolyphosphatase [Geobacteraceae bacterium GWC2_55_20]|nr:MAG: exopolyphosphatase [Geobacteraceae bacterium GWC2_55_20]OGU26230.1 MAG: exopolyphosphatase [Geobacteraceae bacterium GWF2_54_21]HBA73302.1 exopolyphosphatase [Geobacter sp.]HCE68217.1 exopolyphosphatase [Geobacter sp.]
MKCAAIDFGTNTARLLIGERINRKLSTLRVEREIVRLGGGFSDDMGLSEEAQKRGLNCLKKFAGIIREYGVEQIRASATSAVRDAVNGATFVEHVFRETGIRLNVIGGDLEGRLTLEGVISGLDVIHEKMVVLDVGGGSTELTVAENGIPQFVRSIPLGVVRLTEGFTTFQSMNQRIVTVLNQLETEMSAAGICGQPGSELVATAGTATTLAAIQMEMTDYDYRRVNNFLISRAEIEAIYQRLLPLSPSERISIPGLEKGREDLIMAGILITGHVMDRFGFGRLKVSDYGLLEGLAISDVELV